MSRIFAVLLLLAGAAAVGALEIGRTPYLQHAVGRQAQVDFCFPFAPACCVRYEACTGAKCVGYCGMLMRRCSTIDLARPRYAGYAPYCVNAASAPQCFRWCMSRKCGALYCNNAATPWANFKNFFRAPAAQ